eukprot:gene1450-1828_t
MLQFKDEKTVKPVTNVSLSEKLAAWNQRTNNRHPELAKAMMDTMSEKPLFEVNVNATKEEQRQSTLLQLESILINVFGKGHISIKDLKEKPSKILTLIDCVAHFDDCSLMTKLVVNNFLFGASVYNLGTERHHKMLPDIQSGKILGCFAMTELGHGSNVRSLETTATYDPKTDEFIIQTPTRTATKWWIGNSAHATIASVFARLIIDGKDHEVHCFLVPIRKQFGLETLPGVKIGDVGSKFGMNGVDNGWIQFDGVRVPSTNLLDKFGSVVKGVYSSPISSPSKRFATILAQMITGRLSIAFGSTRVLKSALIISTRYACRRLQFGPTSTSPEIPIMDYPTHYLTLMPMIATVYAFDSIKTYVFQKFEEKNDGGETHVLASGLKALVSQYATVSIMECRRLCGGNGYWAHSRLGRMVAAIDIGRTFEGDNTLLLQQVAKDLLTQFKKEYTSNKFTGTLKYLGKNTNLLLAGLNPMTTFRSDDAHILSFQFLLDSMEYRSAKLLMESAKVVSKNYKKTKDSFGAWNMSLEILIQLAKAHIETMILAKFIETVNKETDFETKETLKKLCQLYGLYKIREDFEFFRNSNYLKKGKAKAIIKLISTLSFDLSRQALVLVKGFGNDERFIDSPMGFENGNMYEDICKRVGFFTIDNYPKSKL